MDNGAMENFFGRLKVEILKRYIDYCNNERIHIKLKNESGTVPNSFTSKLIFNFV